MEAGALDINSPYAYLLVCTHFASTSIVADDAGGADLAGFIAAYRLPDDRDVLFVWQITVAAAQRNSGLGRRLLTCLLARPGNRDVRWLEATITPSNHPSERLFQSFARSVGARCETTGSYPPDLFPDGDHEPEIRYRIGPLSIEPEP